MTPSFIHPKAESELYSAFTWYEKKNKGLGIEFDDDFARTLQRIESNPLQFSADEHECRACPFERFPYTVYYRVMPDGIYVWAVAHQSRQNNYWIQRLAP